jgi:hypothetical protein
MKLFSEYYAGNVNHDFHLFGDDDIQFLEQFPAKLWEYALKYRYCVDLPKALLSRDEARTRPLKGLKDADGNPITLNYNDLIQNIADRTYEGLTYKGNNQAERNRITNASYHNAKNIVDSNVAEMPDGGSNPWMDVVYPRKGYHFYRNQKGTLISVGMIIVDNNYIPELVKRIEGGKGSSSVGFDLSNLKNFDPGKRDDEQEGRWHTDGFHCPTSKQFADNLKAWVSYSSQGLLNDPASDEDPETHRSITRSVYAPSSGAREEILDDSIYKDPLFNYYRGYITKLKKELRSNGSIPDRDFTILRRKFNSRRPDGGYSYRLAISGRFPDRLQAQIGTEDAHELTEEQLTHLIQICLDVHNQFQKTLINALVDIDLITHPVQNYHGVHINPETSSDLRVLTREDPRAAGEHIPHLRPGKILYHIDTARAKLGGRNYDADVSSRTIGNVRTDLEQGRGVGHHYNVGDIENPEKQRGRIFLQYADERDIPGEMDLRDRKLGGGIHPNKTIPSARGPGKINLGAALDNLNRFVGTQERLERSINEFITGNYENKVYNMLFKTFISASGAIEDRATYNLFTRLIKDECLRNIGLFEVPDVEIHNRINYLTRMFSKLMMAVCKRIVEKDIGESGAERVREGEISDPVEVRAAIRDHIRKTGG